jgi:hypothetical protein
MKRILLLLFLFGLSAAQEPSDILRQEVLNPLISIIVPFMFAMVALAAAVYVIGQMFGAETRAKTTVWAHGMLAAVGITGVVVVLLYFLLPSFMTGGDIPGIDDPKQIETAILSLIGLAQNALVALIAIFAVLSAAVYAGGYFSDAQTRAKSNVYATGLLAGAVVSAILYIVIFEIFKQLATTFFAGTILASYFTTTAVPGTVLPGGPYIPIVIMIAFFTSVVVLITYLLSKFFKVPEWEAYLSIELSNIMSSFLLVLFIIGLFAVGDVVAKSFTGMDSPPQAAIGYLRAEVADSILRGIYDTYIIQACTSMLSTMQRRIGEFVLTQTYKVFPGMDTFVSITNVIGFGLVSIYASVSAQIALLYFVDSTMRNFFLPAGLILRFFPPTRDAGAFLISLAFGMQIIFPTAYMINQAVFDDIGAEHYKSRYALMWSLCGPLKYGAMGVLINPGTNPIFGWIPGGAAIGTLLMRLVSETTLNLVSMSEFIPILRHISALSLLAIFIPALSMLITIAFINSMTKFIVAKV